MSGIAFLAPNWPAPANIRAATSCRTGGVSTGPYRSLNLGLHVGDHPEAVHENRRRLREALQLPGEPRWLEQVHGTEAVSAAAVQTGCRADGAFSDQIGVVCTVMTADCLPVLFCSRDGTRVAAAHAGWRGLADGILERTVAGMGAPGAELLAWLGPAIGPHAFEVGEEVRARFVADDPAAADAFRPSPQGRWLADIYRLARQRLAAVGITAVYGGDYCTYQDAARFYSYRRDGVTGRMVSLIWRES